METRAGTRLVVGLGNPGPEYEWTPHNLGFHVVDLVARQGGAIFEPAASLEGYRGPSQFRWARIEDPEALLIEPETFMNRSGDVVAPLAEWCGIGPEALLVVLDDIDLPFGSRRIRPHGGTGGHRGMESIVSRLGTDRFPRLRMGVGRPSTDAARHVLSRFSRADLEVAAASVAEAAEAVLSWLRTGDIERCMARFHSRWNPGPSREGARTQEER
jgi:PTH1 family peptidyl-tRNA hydrolase